MVIFDLICDFQHEFEGWFRNSEELANQQRSGLLTCPICDSGHVNKKVSAPKVGKKSNSTPSVIPSTSLGEGFSGDSMAAVGSKEAYFELQNMLKNVHDYVESNFKDVGGDFVDEALSMHKGEKENVNIRGTASMEQLKELEDEGVTTLPLPPKPVGKDDLN